MTFRYLKAAVLDWAGTTVDFGSLAPVVALERVFAEAGVPVTAGEIREHMGTLKKDQIRSICASKRVAQAWRAAHGADPSETDVERLFQEFLPRQTEILAEFSRPIPCVPETVESWRAAGMKIGSSTGYTRALLDIVMPRAAARGYAPDASVTPDEVGGGRPLPFMCYRNAILLGAWPLWHCVKIGDTPSDVREGRNAGMWTIGITATGNEIGLPQAEWEALAPEVRAELEGAAAEVLRGAGAHFVAPSLAGCTALLDEIERRIAAGEKP
ncbi:MAG TPA: phosphonoacetaldehyde hydrolase [Bryobacteraceae bacterium]|nr:phosphonoacetaldehyde hydrolase [Bryobacteraceae bacterium]